MHLCLNRAVKLCKLCANGKQSVKVTMLQIVLSLFLLFLVVFHRKFAPRCCVCSEPIMPAPGQEETVRIVALDRDFHVQCYRCEVRALCLHQSRVCVCVCPL